LCIESIIGKIPAIWIAVLLGFGFVFTSSQVELPLTHRFTPGMYIRTIFMPKGALVISKIHRTQHPFVVTKGRCSVWPGQAAPGQLDANGLREIVAGHIGITMPGTRRILYIHEDTEWTTFHATDKTTPEEVEAEIIEPHDFDREEALAQLTRMGQMGRINGLVDKWINGGADLLVSQDARQSVPAVKIPVTELAKPSTENPGLPKVKSSPGGEDTGEGGRFFSAQPLANSPNNPAIQ
jgi:hypothetical protein